MTWPTYFPRIPKACHSFEGITQCIFIFSQYQNKFTNRMKTYSTS